MSEFGFHYSARDLRNTIEIERKNKTSNELIGFYKEIIERMVDASSDHVGMRANGQAKKSFLHVFVNKHVPAECLELAIKKASNIDVRSLDCGCTPLMDAVADGNLDVAKLLIKNGADIKLKDKDGMGLLHHAVFSGNLEMLEFVLKLNNEQLNEFARGDYEVLLSLGQVPVKNADDGVVRYKMLKDEEVCITYCTEDDLVPRFDYFENEGLSPLLIAIETSNVDLVQALLQSGADPNLCSPVLGCNALTFNASCVLSGVQDLVSIQKLLIKYGGDIKQRDLHGYDVFALSAVSGNSKLLINILNEYDIDLNAQYKVFPNNEFGFKNKTQQKIGKIKDFIEEALKKTTNQKQRQQFEEVFALIEAADLKNIILKEKESPTLKRFTL